MPTDQLTCQKCGYKNELQRVYCHNCGEKLDRSALAPLIAKQEKQTKRAARKAAMRSQGPLKAKVSLLRLYILPGINSILLGAFAASAICMLTPPQDLPGDIPEELRLNPPNLKIALESTLELPTATRFAITAEQLNAYFASRVGARSTGVLGFVIAWDRAASRLSPGKVTLFIIRRLVAGSEPPKKSQMSEHFPIVVQADFEVALVDGEPGISAKATGGRIGRLIVPGPIMDALKGLFFGELAAVLKEEIRNLGKMRSIKIVDGAAEIESRGVAR